MFEKKKYDTIPEDPTKTFEIKREKDKIMFIGKDGRYYSDAESLKQANDAWLKQNYKYKGMDGRDYSDAESLKQANEEYRRRMFAAIDKETQEK